MSFLHFTTSGATHRRDLGRARARLAELCRLEAGWHDGDGAAMDAAAVHAAENFLDMRPSQASASRIYPTDAGGVLFEFESRGWDYSVEFGAGGSVQFYGIEINGTKEIAPQSFMRLNQEFFGLFDQHART